MFVDDDGRFKVRELTDQEVADAQFLNRLSTRYFYVTILCLAMMIFLVIKSRYLLAFLTWILSNTFLFAAAYYRQKAKSIGDE